jgi:hypothetical protein
MNNLVENPEFASLQKDLESRLQEKLKKNNDPFFAGQYYIDLWGYSVRNGKSIPWKPGTPVQSPLKRHG